MAATATTDVIVPQPVVDMVLRALSYKSAFVGSGAAAFDPSMQGQAGNFFNVPEWNEDLTVAEKIDGNASTPAGLTQNVSTGAYSHRKRSRSWVGNVPAVMGSLMTPDAAIVNSAADFWAYDLDQLIINVLKGLFYTSTGAIVGTHMSSIAAASGAIKPATFSTFLDARAVLGDNNKDLAIAVFHSKQWNDLRKEAGSKATYIASESGPVPFYDGMRVIESDNVPTSGSGQFKKYTGFLVGPGAIYVAVQQAIKEWMAIEPLVPRVDLTQTISIGACVRGTKWAVTTTNPDLSDLATATNWAKSAASPTTATDKLIKVVGFETNAS
jgi:hypothetical protein